MLRYLNNISTFRMILFCLLVVTAGVLLFDVSRRTEDKDRDRAKRQKLADALKECGQDFGQHVAIQESLAIALATQYEMLDNPEDSEKIGEVLSIMLDNTPDFILGVGIALDETSRQPRKISYVAKNQSQTPENLRTALLAREEDDHTTAREVNISRNMNWLLMASPASETEKRFSTVLSVSLGDATANPGVAIVKANLDWIAELLRRLIGAGAETPLCITPHRDVLWLEKDRLIFDKDFQPGEDSPARTLVYGALRDSDSSIPSALDRQLTADILGTGWMLVVPLAESQPPARRPLSFPAIIFIVAACLLLLDALISSLVVGTTASGAAGAAPAERPGRRGLLSNIYSLLFRYRITNPDRERIDSEMRVARKIQFSLVPDFFPAYSEWREFDLYSVLSPAREVGGDYYDFFMLDSNRLVLAVGDVSGKGFPAALYMAVSRTAFRTLAREADNPGDLLTRLNDLMVRDNQSGLYVTIAACIIDLPSGRCEYAIAGHPAPLWYEAATAKTVLVDSPREIFIGLKPGISFPVGSFELQPGDTLLLYSDGVSEARDPAGNELEYEGLISLFEGSVGEDRCETLIKEMARNVSEFTGSSEPQDDITLLAFRYWGQGGQKLLRKKRGMHTRSHSHGT